MCHIVVLYHTGISVPEAILLDLLHLVAHYDNENPTKDTEPEEAYFSREIGWEDKKKSMQLQGLENKLYCINTVRNNVLVVLIYKLCYVKNVPNSVLVVVIYSKWTKVFAPPLDFP